MEEIARRILGVEGRSLLEPTEEAGRDSRVAFEMKLSPRD